MKFGIYLPPKAETRKCPVLYWLSGKLHECLLSNVSVTRCESATVFVSVDY